MDDAWILSAEEEQEFAVQVVVRQAGLVSWWQTALWDWTRPTQDPRMTSGSHGDNEVYMHTYMYVPLNHCAQIFSSCWQ